MRLGPGVLKGWIDRNGGGLNSWATAIKTSLGRRQACAAMVEDPDNQGGKSWWTDWQRVPYSCMVVRPMLHLEVIRGLGRR